MISNELIFKKTIIGAYRTNGPSKLRCYTTCSLKLRPVKSIFVISGRLSYFFRKPDGFWQWTLKLHHIKNDRFFGVRIRPIYVAPSWLTLKFDRFTIGET